MIEIAEFFLEYFPLIFWSWVGLLVVFLVVAFGIVITSTRDYQEALQSASASKIKAEELELKK